jgi:hypothetical protein
VIGARGARLSGKYLKEGRICAEIERSLQSPPRATRETTFSIAGSRGSPRASRALPSPNLTMINYVLDKSKNYAGVQESILGIVTRHLPPGSYTTTFGKHRPGAVNFSLFVRQPADFVMSHGVADKNYFTDVRDAEGKLFANRLRGVFVPGQWLKRKLLAFPELKLRADQIHTVGWPRLDALRARPRTAGLSSRPRVLWAPTHDFVKRGDEQLSTSTFPAFGEHLPQLEKLFDVSVSVHPRNRPSKTPTLQSLIDSDCVVSDFGTMVYEAWSLGKPVIFPRWLLGDRIQKYLPGSAEAHIFEQRIGYHPESIEELIEIVAGGPVVSPAVHDFMNDYVDNHAGGSSGARVAALLRELALHAA